MAACTWWTRWDALPGSTTSARLHEQACAFAAEAYAEVTNGLGVMLVTTGPGGTNAITGVAAAWLESASVLFISGQAKRADLIGATGVRSMGQQEVDIVSVVTPITKYAVTVLDPAIDPLPPREGRLARDARTPRAGLDRYPARRAGRDD